MRRRQALISAIAAAAVGYLTLSAGRTTALAVAILTFFGITWTWATVGRVRYWRPRGGYQTERCPSCNAGRKRLGGDWVLECKTCGWKAGWPLLRNLTHGVIGVQARRGISRRGAFLVGGAVAVLAFGGSAASDPPGGPNVPSFGIIDQMGAIVQQAVMALGGLAILALVIYIAIQPPKQWCENCGFAVGREQPDKCPNCGFNVFTKEKPPAGGVKHVKHHNK